MRDDIQSLPLSKASKKYARITSKDLGSDWSKKVDMFMDMAAAETGQSKEGFHNKDACPKVPHAMKESYTPTERDFQRASKESLMKAAQAWCNDLCGDRVMDANLAIAFAEILDDVRHRGEAAFSGLGESLVRCLVGEGFIAWHASPYTFEQFDTSREGAHFGTREQAENLRKPGKMAAKPYVLTIESPLRIRDLGVWTIDGIATELHRTDIIDDAEADSIYDERNWSDERGFAKIKEILASKGYDGFVYENEQEGPGDSYVAFSTSQIQPYHGKI